MYVYWQEGVRRVSLNEVCRRTGISKPALYREFDDEDGLMDAALQLYRSHMVGPLLAAMEEQRPLAEMLFGAVDRLTAQREAPAGCLFTKMRLARQWLGPRTRVRVEEVERQLLEGFEARVRRAQAAGELDPDQDARVVARYLDTQFATVLVQMAAGVPADLVRAQASLAWGALVGGSC